MTARMAGGIGNTNACKHGLRLQVNTLPKGCARLEGLRRELRRALEAEVAKVKGEVGLTDACLISSAVRWETVAALASRWLRLGVEKMSAGDKLAYIRTVATASDSRDRCIKQLRIEAKPEDFWKRLYSTPPLTVPVAPQAAPDDAPAPGDGQQGERPTDVTGPNPDGHGGPEHEDG